MNRLGRPATVVLCATAPRPAAAGRGPAWLSAARGAAVPVTWALEADALAAVAGAIDGLDVAVDVPPAACGSRSRLRDLLTRCRDVAPRVTAAVLRGPVPAANRGVLVEQGIGVAVVAAFDGDAPGDRRPAPRGWACRSVTWGLWEVRTTPVRAAGLAGWLGLGGPPRAVPGGLHVLLADEGIVSGRQTAPLAPQFDRWIAWAARRRHRGLATVVPLSALPRLIGGGCRTPVDRSVLRAA